MKSFTFHEATQHGTLDFPFEYHYLNAAHPRYNMPLHWHKEWEIIHIIEGTFIAHTDDMVYTVHAGDTLLVRDGMLHGGIPENCIYECFLFDLHGLFRNLDMVKKYLRPIYREQILPEIYYPKGKMPEVDDVISKLSNAYHISEALTAVPGNQRLDIVGEAGCPLELIVLGCISQLFATILQKHTYTISQKDTMDSTHKIDLIKTILEYIELHYASSITLSELAGVANMNPKYFCRFFRSITHQTPMEYVNMYRIEKAAQMLHSTRLPVTDICMECGFNDSSNFIKVFRKYKGMTPKQYRKI
ncbi:MAG: helix-turn-helix transcriptional regulator [Lachnospiraceae bacterium]|nr:helix-turn-helix transcriptional regulator [Lachnospiraceae bacterium]